MQRLSNNCNENMVCPCYSCGYFHHGGQTNCNAYSTIFSMQNHHLPTQSYENPDHNMYGFSTPLPSVDCTLSLGPPSSRGNTNNGSDALLARRCTNCDTTSTPLWRKGPRGPKSLCNACGIRFKKQERRATATASMNRGGATTAVDTQHIINDSSSSWMQHHSAYGNKNEFRFIHEDNDGEVDNNRGMYLFPLFASQHC